MAAEFEIELGDEAATRALAGRLARHVGAGDVIALEGALGTGKTTFARYLIQALARLGGAGEVGEVPSPTFTLVQTYETGAVPVWHFDLYRIERAEEVIELGIDEAFASAVSLIEWPDRLGPYLPAERLTVAFARADGNGRRVCISGAGARGQALAQALMKEAA